MYGSLSLGRPKALENPIGPEPLAQFEADPNKIGIILQANSDTASSITVRPSVGSTSALTAILGASTSSPYLQLGKSTLRATGTELTVSGLPVRLSEGGQSDKAFKVIDDGSITLDSTSYPKINLVSNGGNTFVESVNDSTAYLQFGSSKPSTIQHNLTTGVLLLSGTQFQVSAPTIFSSSVPTTFVSSIKIGNYDNYNGAMIDANGLHTRSSVTAEALVHPGLIRSSNEIRAQAAFNTYSTMNQNGSIELVGADGGKITMKSTAGNTVEIYCGRSTASNDKTLYVSENLTAIGDIHARRVYNAVYNDYAELYERADTNEFIRPGDVIVYDENSSKYIKSRREDDPRVVGVCSDSYGHLLGGTGNVDEDLKNFIPVGIGGRVKVRVIELETNHEFPKVKPGDLLTSAASGWAKVSTKKIPGTIIGKALGTTDEDHMVTMQIMLA